MTHQKYLYEKMKKIKVEFNHIGHLMRAMVKNINYECRKWVNQESVGKHNIKCFRCKTYHTCVFNMAYAGACKYDHTPFPSRPASYFNHWHSQINCSIKKKNPAFPADISEKDIHFQLFQLNFEKDPCS